MPKIDGMDPKLVRDLLAELRSAAKEMETIEAKATTTVRNAGVPAAVTYRPSAVADAIAEMDKDVTARLALLEKREREPGTQPNPTTSGDANPAPKPTGGDSEPPKKPSGDADPPKKGDTETTAPNRSDDSNPPPKKSDGETEPPKKGDTESAAPDRSDDSNPPPKKPEGETESPKKGDTDSNPPPKKSDGEPPIDTPKKDHPDDIDQTKGRVELDVDGTKVVSYPLNQDLDVVRPVDSAQPPTGPQPDGKPGYVEPLEPTVKHPAPQPGLDPGDPMGPYVGTAADNVTEDPYLKNNPAAAQPAPQPGLAPGDPMGAYVGTAADNVTEDPYLKGNPVTQPPPQPGLAPGDPMGAYVGTAADNVTEDPYLKGNPVTPPAGDPSGANVGTAGNVPEDPFLASAPQLPADTTLVSGDAVDPKALAAAQPGDVLSAPANPISDQALGALLGNDSQIGPQGMPTVTDGSGSAGGGNPPAAIGGEGTNDSGSQQPSAGGNSGNSSSPQGGNDGQCGPQGGDKPAANGSANGQAGLTTGPTMAHYGPAGLSADGQSGLAGQAGAEIDPKKLAAEQPGDVLSAPANPISDQALGALLNIDSQIGPQEMPSMTGGGSGAEGGPGGNGSDQSASGPAAAQTPSASHAGGDVDPRRLAAEQPGDVLSVPAHHISDQALGALLGFDDQIGPQETPSMAGAGSGSEGGPAQGPAGGASGDGAGAAQGSGPDQSDDPRRLAAEQPGDVLSAPAKPISDEAILALMDVHAQIEPIDMPSVSVPAGEWGTGEWVPEDIEPDGPAGSVAPGQPA
ncbi:hypothetical protein FDA94_06890 [Herbidospora galbida]|uniref:Uncharacterized protein n=1 Tax=Herbidospora galbida TaxID=2575442 RepID=A0A4U3MKM5_9ACTN|nr:hypothetical protein [Herbidospora galbida]TKK90138.1 hypothetical protein FDA94_06890 [Herbidospora galbida]